MTLKMRELEYTKVMPEVSMPARNMIEISAHMRSAGISLKDLIGSHQRKTMGSYSQLYSQPAPMESLSPNPQ